MAHYYKRPLTERDTHRRSDTLLYRYTQFCIIIMQFSAVFSIGTYRLYRPLTTFNILCQMVPKFCHMQSVQYQSAFSLSSLISSSIFEDYFIFFSFLFTRCQKSSSTLSLLGTTTIGAAHLLLCISIERHHPGTIRTLHLENFFCFPLLICKEPIWTCSKPTPLNVYP